MTIRFAWDEEKNAANIKKHGISFVEAKHVFFDQMRRECFDTKHSVDEERWIIIGMSGCNILKVIYKDENDHKRIISARKANHKEKEDYFYGYGL
jgi:uncharacterized DUF497 family protein